MRSRGQWQGMCTIARLNWPYYLVAVVVCLASLAGFWRLRDPLIQIICGIAFVGAAYFITISLGVSHWIYDRSDLYQWNWLRRVWPGMSPRRVIFCHSGFDEVSEELRARWPEPDWVILDHFESERMTESSIRRARKMFPPTRGTVAARFNEWPVAEESSDLIFGLLAVHELRSEQERVAWFLEAARCLQTNGSVVLVEHLRDLANFFVFGPGFIHFHSSSNWKKCWEAAGLQLVSDFQVTLWVRVFVLKKP